MSESSSSSSSGIGVVGLLGVVFVTLKLLHIITWSWWWVTAPFWGGIALFCIVFLGIIGVATLTVTLKGLRLRRKRVTR